MSCWVLGWFWYGRQDGTMVDGQLVLSGFSVDDVLDVTLVLGM